MSPLLTSLPESFHYNSGPAPVTLGCPVSEKNNKNRNQKEKQSKAKKKKTEKIKIYTELVVTGSGLLGLINTTITQLLSRARPASKPPADLEKKSKKKELCVIGRSA